MGRRSRLSARCAFAIGLALVAPGCPNNGGGPPNLNDGGMDVVDPPPRTLAIAVTGCDALGSATASCQGAPPLVLSFAPVGSPEITRFLWTFGDGSPAVTERAPTHTYVLPGTYSVRLVGGGPFGEIAARNEVRVEIAALSAGAPCDVETQCAGGLVCVCGVGAGCSAAFARGLCSTQCDRGSCGVGSTCVALPIGPRIGSGVGSGDAGAPEPLCLADCVRDSDCNPGLVCVGAPAGGNTASARWTAACLPPGAYKRVGDACRAPDGALQNDVCATGTCADVGALGVCSATCGDDLPCPIGSSCVRLGDGRRLCLETCSAVGDCGLDPLMACASVEAGPVMDGGAPPTVCSPKVCASEADCAPAGRCAADAHCIRR